MEDSPVTDYRTQYRSQPADIGKIEPDVLYGIPQAARLLGLHYETFREWVRDGGVTFCWVKKRKKVLGVTLLNQAGQRGPHEPARLPSDNKRRRDEDLKRIQAEARPKGGVRKAESRQPGVG